MTVKLWKCSLCNEKIPQKEQIEHLQYHIDAYYLEEVAAFRKTRIAEALFRKITGQNP